MEKYAEISADINQKISSWPPTPKIYSFLGKEKMNEKDDRGAVDYFKKAVELYEKEETIEDVESFFSDCTNLYTSQYFCGQFEDAIATIDKLNDFEMKLKGTIPLYTNSVRVSYKCTLLALLGKLEEAYKLANETRAQFSEETPNGVKVRVLYTLYVIAFEAGDYERALKFLQEEDEVLATEHPETYWERLDAMLVMANLNSSLGNHSEAVRLIRHMIDVKQEVYKQSLSEYKNDIYYLANLEAFSGVAGNVEHLQDAKKHFTEYTHLEAEDIKLQAPWMTSDQRLKMWEKAQAKMVQATGFASRLGAFNEQMDIDAYNAHLLTTGLLLKTEKTMNDAIELYGSEDDKKLLGSLNEKRNNYAEIQREGDVAKMAECQIEIQNIENKLCKSVAKMPGASSLLDAEYADIHKALKPGEVLIDFAQSGTRLHAYIIRPEWEYPQLVRLCNDADIYAVSESLDANIYRQEQSDQIRALLIDSVLTYVKPADCIYYVPTGVVHGIALENLLDKYGKALSETYTNMKRLSLANNLINNREKLSPKTATIYGGLDYGDYAVATNTADSEKKYVNVSSTNIL